METDFKNRKACYITCGAITSLVIIIWTFAFSCNILSEIRTDLMFYSFLLVSFFYIVSLSIIIIDTVATYKRFKIESAMKEKENDFNRKKELEHSESLRYSQMQTEKKEDEKLDKKIKEICEKILAEWQSTYQANMKSLKDNVELYNTVKNIIENKPKDSTKNKKTE